MSRPIRLSRYGLYLRCLAGIFASHGLNEIRARLPKRWWSVREFVPLITWALDQYAYEHRDDRRRFQRWLERGGAGRQTTEESSSPDICEVSVAELEEVDVSELLSHQFVLVVDRTALRVPPRAVSQMQAALVDQGADVVYGDEYCLGPEGPCRPFFKPDFSPALLYERDYIGPALLVRGGALAQVLAARGAEPRQGGAYGLLLAAIDLNLHVTRAAGAWLESTEHRKQELTPEQQSALHRHRDKVRRASQCSASQDQHLVSIIIPTRDRTDLLEACLESVVASNPNMGLEVIIIDNGSCRPESKVWFDAAADRFGNVRTIRVDEPFNWSRLNNYGRQSARGDVVVFLNNDIVISTDDWLDRLVSSALEPSVGAVGAFMSYPSGLIQHAGIAIGIGGLADHLYAGIPARPDDHHVFVHPLWSRNVAATTGACLAIEATKFDGLGGFDEEFAIAGDVDLCLRAHASGLRNVYNARVRMIHHESATRLDKALPESEIRKLGRTIEYCLPDGDPYYHPMLSKLGRYPTFH